jgi:hypothetical protein
VDDRLVDVVEGRSGVHCRDDADMLFCAFEGDAHGKVAIPVGRWCMVALPIGRVWVVIVSQGMKVSRTVEQSGSL